MRGLLALLAVLLASGCICCGGDLDTDGFGDLMGGDTDDYDSEPFCTPPYIQVGSDCCVDKNDNGICDEDEGDAGPAVTSPITTAYQAPTTASQAPTTVAVSTTSPAVTTTAQPAITTTIQGAYAPTYQCVKDVWGQEAADGVFYFYSTRCGDKYISTASNAQGRTGVEFTKIKIGGMLDDKKRSLMECFYGTYSEANKEFTYCPRLLCPKTGEIKDLKGLQSASVSSQMSGFAKSC